MTDISFSSQHWLDPMKPIKKQVKGDEVHNFLKDAGLSVCSFSAIVVKSGDFSFRFRVKLYPVSTTYIFDEVTRYFLSLQLKEDLVNMKLVCSDETYSVLAGYVVQGEFGDYDPIDHTSGYLDDFPFLETRSSSIKFKVEELHQKNRYRIMAKIDEMTLNDSLQRTNASRM